jgi:hypothetical protein
MRTLAAALRRYAPATPGGAALVGHWRKNEKQTLWPEWHWVSDEPEASPCSPGLARRTSGRKEADARA